MSTLSVGVLDDTQENPVQMKTTRIFYAGLAGVTLLLGASLIYCIYRSSGYSHTVAFMERGKWNKVWLQHNIYLCFFVVFIIKLTNPAGYAADAAFIPRPLLAHKLSPMRAYTSLILTHDDR